MIFSRKMPWDKHVCIEGFALGWLRLRSKTNNIFLAHTHTPTHPHTHIHTTYGIQFFISTHFVRLLLPLKFGKFRSSVRYKINSLTTKLCNLRLDLGYVLVQQE